MAEQQYVVTPFSGIVKPLLLLGTLVQASLFDDPQFRHEKYIGTIEAVKMHKWGPVVHFKTVSGPSHIVGQKWLPLHKLSGYAHVVQMQKAAS